MGCSLGKHKGQPKNHQVKFCINHGPQNKKFGYPDSFCGKPWILQDDGKTKSGGEGTCGLHAGTFKAKKAKEEEGTWDCCQAEGRSAQPCQEGGNCSYAVWPEEEAKKYFYDRPLKNEAERYKLVYAKERPPHDFQIYGRFCGVFRVPKPYRAHNPGRPDAEITPDEQRKMDNTERYCLNYACKKIFKQVDNNKKACKSHSGKWDFGFESHGEKHESLWEPHWTCCRGRWEDEGCTLRMHRGPFTEDYNKAPRKIEWPEEDAKNYFFKRGEPLRFH